MQYFRVHQQSIQMYSEVLKLHINGPQNNAARPIHKELLFIYYNYSFGKKSKNNMGVNPNCIYDTVLSIRP